ncbi:phosphopantothenoylcysteine decarboxylase [Mitosporidium daphniae]|uniref:Phosphopantothenoylcysteine decarboxylase n=1 Tax=Mitosporidium daphniae TaxID=1485682 RepID=A0A098VMB1_9MICR|nr:phosphopantothenoylcysteine decarboxylase [Mitosporidium daphniae]KGG50232.1 phosphopantothenoylcysteine decarboxylase [Mitosporidium daphniae]|eukprot:XP_013236659.1 phosphopantothenoylcysteine decarboxylase [Mitosporidium daphniae]
MNLLLGLTGSVAAIKLPLLLSSIEESLPVVLTSTAEKFIKDVDINAPVYRDEDEWIVRAKGSANFLELEETGRPGVAYPGTLFALPELRDWCDVILIAPLDANSLEKIAHGMCDNLLTNIIRASIPHVASCPKIMVAPAMNTAMWQHPCTNDQLGILKSWGMRIIPPAEKLLACGDFGGFLCANVA